MTIFYIYFLSKCEEGTKVYMSTVFRRTHVTVSANRYHYSA